MDREQYDALTSTTVDEPTISIEDLDGRSDRTLLVGDMTGGDTLHVYVRDGLLARHVYDQYGTTRSRRHALNFTVSALSPSESIAPEASDFLFVLLLRERGGHVALGAFDEAFLEPIQADIARGVSYFAAT